MSTKELRRLNVTYNVIEDRVRLIGYSANGEAVVLWLTQRLLNRLLPRLDSWFRNHQVPRRLPVSGALAQASSKANPFQHSLLDRMPLAPVKALSDVPAWRVDTVTLRQGTQWVELIFMSDGVSVAKLSLIQTDLGQWLNLLNEAYRLAGWPSASRINCLKDGDAPLTTRGLPDGVVLH